MSAEGSKRAIIAALLANAGIAAAKFVGFLITGSSSMAAEAVHSVADTSNQGLLLLGQSRAAKQANRLHPFGYGRSRYFYSFVVALVLFTLGSMFAIYEGIEKVRHAHDHALESPIVAVVILAIAICLEGYSFRTAYKESKPLKGDATWWQFIRNARTPELPVVLLEDSGALIGLVLALGGVGLTMITDNAVWDGVGTLAIGALLGVIAIILIVARTVGYIFQRIGQSQSIGEIFAGVLLGPSVFGWLFPSAFQRIFRGDGPPILPFFSHIALILTLFLIGMEFDYSEIPRHAKKVVALALSTLLVPLGTGAALAVGLWQIWGH